MKLLKKIFVPFLAALCVVSVCAAFTACDSGETDVKSKYAEEDDDTNWDYTTYIVYLQLPDGTPVEGVNIEICSNTCNDMDTNADGRMYVTFDSSRQGEEVYAHFHATFTLNETTGEYGYVEDDVFPDGYTFPAGSSSNDIYGHIYYLTSKVTTLTLVAE